MVSSHSTRHALLSRALEQSMEELATAERCFQAWLARQREGVAAITALPPETPHDVLVAETDRLKCGTELEDLLRAISSFPATIDHALIRMPAVDAAATQCSTDGRERIMVRRSHTVGSASVQHVWAPFFCKVDVGVLLLFPSLDASQPSAAFPLERYRWEYAGGGREMKEGLYEMQLRAVEEEFPAVVLPNKSAPSAQGEGSEKETRDYTGAQEAASGGTMHTGQQETLAKRWAGALKSTQQPQQQVARWWQGLTNLGKLGKGKSNGVGAGEDVEVWLRSDSAEQAQRFHDLLQSYCCASPRSPSPAPTTEFAPKVAVQVEKIPSMKVWELIMVLKEIDIRHEASSTVRERLSQLYSSQEPATFGAGTYAIEDMLPQLCNITLQVHMEMLALTEDGEGTCSHAVRPQCSLEVWLVDEMTSNLHLGLLFSWSLDAGAPPELVPSLLPEDWNNGGKGTLGYTSLQSSSFSSSISGTSLLAGGGGLMSGVGGGLMTGVGAVGGAAFSGVTRSLSFVSGKAVSAEVCAKILRHEAYRTLRMLAETAGLSGRRMGQGASTASNASSKPSATDAIYQRLSLEDQHMRQLYGEKCPFEPLTNSAKCSRFALDCIKEELTRRKDFMEAERKLTEQLTRVSALLSGVPKDARASQMRRMLQEIDSSLPTAAYIPLCHSAESHEVVVALVYEEAVCLSTFERAPYAVAVEMVALPHTLRDTYCVVRSVELLHYWLNLRHQTKATEGGQAGPCVAGEAPASGAGVEEAGEEAPGEEAGEEAPGEEAGEEAPGEEAGEEAPGALRPGTCSYKLQQHPRNLLAMEGVSGHDRAPWSRQPSVVTWNSIAPISPESVRGGGGTPTAATPNTLVTAVAAAETIEGTGWFSGKSGLWARKGGLAGLGVGFGGKADTGEDECDDSVVLVTPRDTPDSSSKEQVVDEGVGLGWWWRPRRDATESGQTGDVSVLDKVFGETWASRSERRRKNSIYGSHEGWRLRPLILKAGDDLRQEQFAMHLISSIHAMWQGAGLTLRVRPYAILATSPSTGLMEMIPDTVSLAALRKRHVPFVSLEAFYVAAFGDGSDGRLQDAQFKFVRSMAAYSIICYILKVKDRHDGNILLQRDGSVVHIDWGYLLGRSMNNMLEVERAPFKLTRDHVAVMGGEFSANFISYISLCVQGLQVLRERGSELVDLVKAMSVGSALVCINAAEIAELEERLALKYTEKQVVERFIMLQGQALRSWSTGAYDLLQTFLGT